MAQIIIDIPDDLVSRVVDAVASEHNYNLIKDGDKTDFAKVQIIKFLKKTVIDYEISQQNSINSNSISADVETKLIIS